MKKQIILGKNIFLSNFKRAKFPYKLIFSVTNKCNSRCRTCNNWKKKLKNELDLDEIEKLFINANKFSWITLSGGEPFLRNDLVDIVKIINDNCKNLYLFTIATNSLLTEKIIRDMKKITEMDIPKIILTISLDGPKKTHDYIRGVNGSYEKAIDLFKKIKKLNKKNLSIFFGITLSKYNMSSFMETYSEVKKEIPDLGIEEFHINVYHESKHNYNNLGLIKDKIKYNNNLIKDVDFIKKSKKNKFNIISYLGKKYLVLAEKYLKFGKCPIKCKVALTSCFMDPYGNVYPCSIYNKIIGNIKNFDYELKKIWNSKGYNKVRKDILLDRCPQCWTPCEAYQSLVSNVISLFKK